MVSVVSVAILHVAEKLSHRTHKEHCGNHSDVNYVQIRHILTELVEFAGSYHSIDSVKSCHIRT